VHGDLAALRALASELPSLSEDATIVSLGDYIDRGPFVHGARPMPPVAP